MIRSSRILFVLPLAVAVLALDGVACADDEEVPAARALVLFRLGRIDVVAGRYSDALTKLADSQRLDPGAGTMINLAFCYEKLGKTATAWAEYQAAAALAREEGHAEWERGALAQARRLEASLLRVVIRVREQADLESLEVRLDRAPLPRSLWGQPMPLDPGRHELRATAAKRLPWWSTFDVDPEHVPNIAVPALEPADTPQGTAVATPGELGPTPERAQARGGASRRTAAIVIGGAGIAAIAAGAGLGLWAKATYDGAHCVSGVYCTPKGSDTKSRAYTEAALATVFITTGAVAVADAAFLWFSAPPRPTSLRVQPTVGQTAWGLSLGGAW